MVLAVSEEGTANVDVHDPSSARFGPTAKLVPTLERGRVSTVGDFLDVFGLNASAFLSYANVLSDRILLPYVPENHVYYLPEVGPRAFLPHVRGVVPGAEFADIERAEGYGGVRPQIVDTAAKSLDMGEAAFRAATIDNFPRGDSETDASDSESDRGAAAPAV